ncbi:MAG: hypothetical protein AAF799_08505 [Myxococcota bacterium]
MKHHLWIPSLGLSWALAVACTSTTESIETNAEACQIIIDSCHPKDDGSEGQINDCHAIAHDGDAEVCTPMLDECVAVCDAAPPLGGHETDDHSGHETDGEGTGGHESGEHDSGGHETEGHDGGTEGHEESGTDGGESTSDGNGSTGDGAVSVECVAHCDCLETECAEYEGYPFGTRQACEDDCMGLSAEEQACYMMWCPEVPKNPGIALHLCEHAWGELGLNEC